MHISDLAAWCAIDFADSSSNPLCYAHNLYLNDELITDLVIPAGVTRIGSYAFYNCSGLTSVTIGNSVTSIGAYAFNGCSGLTSVSIPNSVTSIGSSAFSGCGSLTSITLPFIGGSASAARASRATLFGYIFGTSDYAGSTATRQYYASGSSATYYIPTSLKSVTITGGNIFYGAFYNCSGLTSVTIGNSVTSIGSSAFYNCYGLTEVHITDLAAWCAIEFGGYSSNPLYYAHNLYLNGKLITNLIIPDSVTSIGDYAFYNCGGLTSVTIPDSVTSIGSYAFYNCDGLTSVTIPDSVTSIGDRAFYDCSGLTSVTIGNGVTSIGGRAFSDCSGLRQIHFNAVSVEDLSSDSNVFWEVGSNSNGITVEFGDDVQTIPNYLFYVSNSSYSPNITSVTIGDGVTSIGGSAFYNCSGLTSITIPESVTSIGEYAFA